MESPYTQWFRIIKDQGVKKILLLYQGSSYPDNDDRCPAILHLLYIAYKKEDGSVWIEEVSPRVGINLQAREVFGLQELYEGLDIGVRNFFLVGYESNRTPMVPLTYHNYIKEPPAMILRGGGEQNSVYEEFWLDTDPQDHHEPQEEEIEVVKVEVAARLWMLLS